MSRASRQSRSPCSRLLSYDLRQSRHEDSVDVGLLGPVVRNDSRVSGSSCRSCPRVYRFRRCSRHRCPGRPQGTPPSIRRSRMQAKLELLRVDVELALRPAAEDLGERPVGGRARWHPHRSTALTRQVRPRLQADGHHVRGAHLPDRDLFGADDALGWPPLRSANSRSSQPPFRSCPISNKRPLLSLTWTRRACLYVAIRAPRTVTSMSGRPPPRPLECRRWRTRPSSPS